MFTALCVYFVLQSLQIREVCLLATNCKQVRFILLRFNLKLPLANVALAFYIGSTLNLRRVFIVIDEASPVRTAARPVARKINSLRRCDVLDDSINQVSAKAFKKLKSMKG